MVNVCWLLQSPLLKAAIFIQVRKKLAFPWYVLLIWSARFHQLTAVASVGVIGSFLYGVFVVLTAESRLNEKLELNIKGLKKDISGIESRLNEKLEYNNKELKSFFTQILLEHEGREDRRMYKASIATILACEAKNNK